MYDEKYLPVMVDELLLRMERYKPGDSGREPQRPDGTWPFTIRTGMADYVANRSVCISLASIMSKTKRITQCIEVIKARLEASPGDKALVRRARKAVDLLLVNDFRHEIPGSHLGKRPAWLDKYQE